MNIIITMAGNSSRFKTAGFKRPKYELIVKEKPMFQWALLSLKNYFLTGQFIFVARKGAEEFIREQCKQLGINHFKILEIDYLTSGQASTALIVIEILPKEAPIMIYNIDTYILDGLLPTEIPKNCDGWIPVFSAEGQQWSFVQMDENKNVTKIAEKERISKWATIGLYYFSSEQLFEQCFYASYANNITNRETYIAPMYQYIISKGGRIKAELIDASKVIPLGTPQEVLKFDSRFFEVNNQWVEKL